MNDNSRNENSRRGSGDSYVADPNRELFESVVSLLAPVLDELVFVGALVGRMPPAAGSVMKIPVVHPPQQVLETEPICDRHHDVGEVGGGGPRHRGKPDGIVHAGGLRGFKDRPSRELTRQSAHAITHLTVL